MSKSKSRVQTAVIVVAVIAVVLAIAIAVASIVGGDDESTDTAGSSIVVAVSSGFSSAEEAATAYAKAVSAERSASTLEELIEARYDMLECWNSAVLQALVDRSDYDDYEEFVITEMYGSETEAEAMVDIYSRLYGSGVIFTLEPGDYLDSDEVADIQDEIDELGLDLVVDSARSIEGSYTKSASDGTVTKSSVGFSGTSLIEIDGVWYIWTNF